MQKEVLEIERNIERLKLQYGGQVLLDQAKKLQQSELMQLAKLKQQYTKLEKNIQRDSTRRYISATTKVSLIKAKKLADKLLGKDDPHVGAAHPIHARPRRRPVHDLFAGSGGLGRAKSAVGAGRREYPSSPHEA